MLALGIRYLTGCVVAGDVADRRHVEWPPHPARIFMALAAAHFQTGEDPAERAALEWLQESPTPPQIHAPRHVERAVVTHYVPVNDKAGPSSAPIQSAVGLTRERQPRGFASAWLEEEIVYLLWPEADATAHFAALDSLCAKVTRIGHSASLVQMWASQEAPEKQANWVPDEAHATERFRVAGPDSLLYLERQFNARETDEYFRLNAAAADATDKGRQRNAKATLRERFLKQPPQRLRPELSLSHGYAPPREERKAVAPGTVFDPNLLVFALCRVDGPYRHLDLAATLQLTGRFRQALLDHLGPEIPEVLSGHSGLAPSEHPHVAIFPLPFVGHEHADGSILGVAVAVPRGIEAASRQRLLRCLSEVRREGLKLGPLGAWRVERPETMAWRDTLNGRAWTAIPDGARQWATVTPYVFDRHAKAKDRASYELELADSVRESWARVRESSEISVNVTITPVSAHLGAPPSHQFPRLARKDGSQCRHTHVILMFSGPVAGPILLGAGRYRGYGLARPL
jgi:CRISPR-associated protein Csb2